MAKNRRHEDHEEHVDESWLIPYADLLTLLLALFIVLYAMSVVDAKKFEEMSKVFEIAFNTGVGLLDQNSVVGSDQLSVPSRTREDNENDQREGVGDSDERAGETINRERVELEQLQKELDQYIAVSGLQNELQTKANENLLTITISNSALFDSGKATVKPESHQLANAISKILQKYPDYEIVVGGHTDNRPISTREFESNWDLSINRAIQFMLLLLENDNLDPAKIRPVGYGQYRPIATNETAAGRAKNRRVEVSLIRIYSNQKDEITVSD